MSPWVAKEEIGTLLLASEMSVPIPRNNRTVREIGTVISEASKRLPMFPLPPSEASKESSCFRVHFDRGTAVGHAPKA